MPWHWLNTELWGPMWPNVFAPNIWTILAVIAHLAVTMIQRERHHREAEAAAALRHSDLKAHITSTAREATEDATTQGVSVPG